MKPWTQLGIAKIPNGGGELTLSRRENEFSIKLSGIRGELMNSRAFNSEQQLAVLGCAHLKKAERAQILVGGMGMGYTLAAALDAVPSCATVTVADLVPEVLEWNRGPLGKCAGRPLDDSRTVVHVGDVGELLDSGIEAYDAVLLDVDNGPEGLTHEENNWLYSEDGCRMIYRSLRPGGVLAVWSAGPERKYTDRLKKSGFTVEERVVRARPGKGSRHTIFVGKKRA